MSHTILGLNLLRESSVLKGLDLGRMRGVEAQVVLSSAQTSAGYSLLGYYFGSDLLGVSYVFLCVNIGAYLI